MKYIEYNLHGSYVLTYSKDKLDSLQVHKKSKLTNLL